MANFTITIELDEEGAELVGMAAAEEGLTLIDYLSSAFEVGTGITPVNVAVTDH